jgi:general secretion pathway protein B
LSFILDALKKAESERNRQSGPVLMDARLAPPRRHLPAWSWALGIVLLANLAILGWLLLRPTHTPTVADQPPPALGAPAQPVAATPPPAVVSTPPSPGAPATPLPEYLDPDSLPTAQQLQATGVRLPALELNLHAYDPAPQNRFVMLNAARMREGEFTPDGIKVERITPRGVVLEASGHRFLLLRAGG